jgi:cleavage stimulation factor subunit 1
LNHSANGDNITDDKSQSNNKLNTSFNNNGQEQEPDSLSPTKNGVNRIGSTGLDFDYESDKVPTTPSIAQYETCYVTSHKAPCRSAAFDNQGTVIATGSVDASIKILDIDRMLAKSFNSNNQENTNEINSQQQTAENHPVIRTLYDHADEITTLAFHPFEPILASGSRDYTVKFFEYAKPSTKKAFKCIQEVEPVRCLSFHPG